METDGLRKSIHNLGTIVTTRWEQKKTAVLSLTCPNLHPLPQCGSESERSHGHRPGAVHRGTPCLGYHSNKRQVRGCLQKRQRDPVGWGSLHWRCDKCVSAIVIKRLTPRFRAGVHPRWKHRRRGNSGPQERDLWVCLHGAKRGPLLPGSPAVWPTHQGKSLQTDRHQSLGGGARGGSRCPTDGNHHLLHVFKLLSIQLRYLNFFWRLAGA